LATGQRKGEGVIRGLANLPIIIDGINNKHNNRENDGGKPVPDDTFYQLKHPVIVILCH